MTFDEGAGGGVAGVHAVAVGVTLSAGELGTTEVAGLVGVVVAPVVG